MANELTVLSAGAVKPGLTKVIDAFQRENGMKVRVSFATAPAILKKIEAGEVPDVVIAPSGALDEITRSGKCPHETAVLGRIGVGVFVRSGEALPDVASVDAFKQSLLGASYVVYNQASTGTYLEKLVETLGVAAVIEQKTIRYPDFAAVLEHISKGTAREIGLGATTVIVENESRGIKLAGSLPAEIQNYTTYIAAIIGEGDGKEAAKDFTRHLSSEAARSLFSAAGIQ